MNQPTWEDFERLEKEQRQLKEEVRQLREQITEPIRIDHLEIARGGTQELLRETNIKLDKIIQTQTDRSEKFDTLEHSQQELKQELHTLSNNWLDTLQKDADEINQEIAGARADILKIRESQADFRDKLEKTVTKDDIASMATKDDIVGIKATQDLILQLLQQKP